MDIKTEGYLKAGNRMPEEKIVVAMKQYGDIKELYKQEHFQEQLYLMIKWGFSDSLIRGFLSNELRLQDIDFFRLLILFTNDYSFIEKTFLHHKFIYEDAINETVEFIFSSKYPIIKEIEALRVEKEDLKRQFELQKEFLQREYDFNAKFHELQHTHAEEIKDIKLQNAIDSFEREKRDLKRTIEGLESDNRMLQQTITSTPSVILPAEEITSTPSISSPAEKMVSKGEKRSGFFKKLMPKSKSNEEEKTQFIIHILQDVKFKTEQYKVILFAFEKGLPLEDIKQLAAPELPVENMLLLCQMFFKKRNMPISIDLKNFTNNEMQNPPVIIRGSNDLEKGGDYFVQEDIAAQEENPPQNILGDQNTPEFEDGEEEE